MSRFTPGAGCCYNRLQSILVISASPAITVPSISSFSRPIVFLSCLDCGICHILSPCLDWSISHIFSPCIGWSISHVLSPCFDFPIIDGVSVPYCSIFNPLLSTADVSDTLDLALTFATYC